MAIFSSSFSPHRIMLCPSMKKAGRLPRAFFSAFLLWAEKSNSRIRHFGIRSVFLTVLNIVLGGTSYEVKVEANQVFVNGKPMDYQLQEGKASAPVTTAPTPTASAQDLTAPMAGTVTKLLVKEGDQVSAGQALLILEVMKMENTISAPQAAVVKKIETGEGTRVAAGQTLIRFG